MAVDYNGLDGTGSYRIVPDGSGSKVTWSFGYDSGTSPLKRWKALMLDSFVGAEYSAGLDRLEQKIESERRPTEPTIGVDPGRRRVDSAAAACRGAAARCGAVPQTGEAPAAGAPADAAAPAAAEATPPAPAPAPPPKKKRRQ